MDLALVDDLADVESILEKMAKRPDQKTAASSAPTAGENLPLGSYAAAIEVLVMLSLSLTTERDCLLPCLLIRNTARFVIRMQHSVGR